MVFFGLLVLVAIMRVSVQEYLHANILINFAVMDQFLSECHGNSSLQEWLKLGPFGVLYFFPLRGYQKSNGSIILICDHTKHCIMSRPTTGCEHNYIIESICPIVRQNSIIIFATSLISHKKVVLKCISDEQSSTREFKTHVRISANHVILPLLDRFETTFDGLQVNVLVFERIETLPKCIDLVLVQQIIKDISSLLKGVHEEGWTHYDINPSNILTRNSNIYLIDWALAKHDSEKQGQWGCGTRGFVSPETYMNPQKHSHVSDIYSLGICLAMWLHIYIPALNLYILGAPLTTPQRVQEKVWEVKIFLQSNRTTLHGAIYAALDLMCAMLEYSETARITSANVLEHPFCLLDESVFVGLNTENYEQKGIFARYMCGITDRKCNESYQSYRYAM